MIQNEEHFHEIVFWSTTLIQIVREVPGVIVLPSIKISDSSSLPLKASWFPFFRQDNFCYEANFASGQFEPNEVHSVCLNFFRKLSCEFGSK